MLSTVHGAERRVQLFVLLVLFNELFKPICADIYR